MRVASRGLLAALALLLPGVVAAQEGTIVLRSQGEQYGFRDPDDASLTVAVFLGGVDVEQGPRRMHGRSLVVVTRSSGREAAGQGDAAGEGLVISQDRVLELYLDGDVTLEEGDEIVLGAASLHIDNATGEVTILQGEWRGSFGENPLVVRYEAMRQLADESRELEGVSYSTCEYAHRHWSIETPWARLVPTLEGNVLHTAGNTVELGGVPVLWLPGVHLNVDRDRPPLRRIGFGESSRLGTEITTLWGGDAAPGLAALLGLDERDVDADWELRLDNYSSRGVFTEPRLQYDTGSSRGEIFGSYIHDHNDEDELDVPIEDHTRGRVKLQHRTHIDPTRTLDVELSYLSDRGYLDEYYEDEARVGKQQETYVNYRQVEDNEAFQVLARARLNDFDTQVEYLPELEQRTFGEGVDTGIFGPAFLTTRSFLSNAHLAAAEQVNAAGDPTTVQPGSARALRGGTAGELSWPVDIAGDRLRIITGYDLTAFDRHVRTPDDPTTTLVDEEVVDEGALARYALTGGFELGRTYSGVGQAQSRLWNFDGVRQVLEPRVGYASVLELNHEPEDLVQIDETESLRKLHTFFVGVRHRIQTHQAGRVATVLDTDVTMLVFPNEERDNPDTDPEPDDVENGRTAGPIAVDTTWKPGARIWGLRQSTVRWRARIDPNEWAYLRSFLSYSSWFGPDRRFAISYDKARHTSNFLTLGLEWILTPQWSAAFFVQEDLRLNENASRGIILRQLAHRWIFDLELSQRRGDSKVDGSKDDEVRISLKMRPAFFEDEDDDESLLDSLGRIRRT